MPNETISASHTSAARFSTGPLGRVLNTSPVAVLQCGLGLAMAVAFVAFSVAARFTVPYRDDWDWLLSLLSQPMTVRSLFAPHNEHIIPLARLLHAAQYKLEGSQGILLFSVAVMAQLSTGCVFCGETAARWTERTRLFVIGVVCTLLFSTFQLQSIVFPAAILFPLVQCFAVIAFSASLTADLRPRPRRLRTCAAALATVAAILTTTNGFAVPVIVAALAWREGRRRTAVGFGVVALGCAIGYAILVGAPWHDGPPAAGQQWALRSAAAMAAYFLTFYGSALAYASIPAAIAVGTGLFGLGCFATWRTIVAGPNATRLEWFCVAAMTFAVASDAMATLGRAAQFGPIQAAQSRYMTFAFVYYAAIILWLFSYSERHRNLPLPAWIAWVTVAVSVALIPANIFVGAVWVAKAANIAAAGMTLALGVNDEAWVSTLHPITSTVYEGNSRLRSVGDPITTDPDVGRRFALDTLPACSSGDLRMVSMPDHSGWRVTGVLPAEASAGLVTDLSGVVIGRVRPAPLVALPNPQEPAVVEAVYRALRNSGPPPSWFGFAGRGTGPFSALVVSASGTRTCRTLILQQ
jgi:hypothetical protein